MTTGTGPGNLRELITELVGRDLRDIKQALGGLTGVPLAQSVQWNLIKQLESTPLWYLRTTPYIFTPHNFVSVTAVDQVILGHGVPTGAETEVPEGLLYFVPWLLVGGTEVNRLKLQAKYLKTDVLVITSTAFAEVFQYKFERSGTGLLKPTVEAMVSAGGEGRVTMNDAEEQTWTEETYTTKEWPGRALAVDGSVSLKARAVTGTFYVRTRGFRNEKVEAYYAANDDKMITLPFPFGFEEYQQIEVVSAMAAIGDHFATLIIGRML